MQNKNDGENLLETLAREIGLIARVKPPDSCDRFGLLDGTLSSARTQMQTKNFEPISRCQN